MRATIDADDFCVVWEIKIPGIYKITNIINGKYYIGSSTDIFKRYKDHLYKGNTSAISRAIRKYGKENFILTILEIVIDETKLRSIELYYINTLNSANRSIGYNICCITSNGKLGYVHSIESRKKQSIAMIGKSYAKPTRRIQIDQYAFNFGYLKTWPSIAMAAKAVGVSETNIRHVLKGKQETAAGFIWKYAE